MSGHCAVLNFHGHSEVMFLILQGTELLNVFDTDDDGISFPEYLLLLTFLKIPVQVSTNVVQEMPFGRVCLK